MYNPDFSKQLLDWVSRDTYIVPSTLTKVIQQINSISHIRLQENKLNDIYSFEIESKIKALGIQKEEINGKVIMDICCWTWFLSYHLLTLWYTPKKILLADISEKELLVAKEFIKNHYPKVVIQSISWDILESTIDKNSIDTVIGNSFLHHFYDIPCALKFIYSILKQWWSFILLHEPSIAALPVESWSILRYIHFLLRWKKYIDDMRYWWNAIRQWWWSDVWIFDRTVLNSYFSTANFIKIKNISYNLVSWFIIKKFRLSRLNDKHKKIITILFKLDKCLRYILLDKWFWWFYMIASKWEDH